MIIKTDYIYCMIDNVTEETHLQYINNLPKQIPVHVEGKPLYQGRILVEIVGEVDTNLGEVQ